MGYTHYWNLYEPLPSNVWGRITSDVAKLIAASPVKVAQWEGSNTPAQVDAAAICFEGFAQSHETFVFDRGCTGFNFCKTARKPYDAVVCGVLVIIADHTGTAVEITSDGDEPDWRNALACASEAVGRTLAFPCKKEI